MGGKASYDEPITFLPYRVATTYPAVLCETTTSFRIYCQHIPIRLICQTLFRSFTEFSYWSNLFLSQISGFSFQTSYFHMIQTSIYDHTLNLSYLTSNLSTIHFTYILWSFICLCTLSYFFIHSYHLNEISNLYPEVLSIIRNPIYTPKSCL